MKKDLEATPFVAVLHWKASIKLKTEKLNEAVGVTRSHVEKLAKSAEEAAFVGDKGEVYKITKELVNANTKADHVVSSKVPPFCCNHRNYFTS